MVESLIPKKLRFVILFLGCMVCLLYAARLLWRAATTTASAFITYTVGARLLAYSPASLPQAYNNDWFAAQIAQAGYPDLYDVFNINPPSMALMLLPLAWMPLKVGQVLWALANLCFYFGGIWALCRLVRLPSLWAPPLAALCLLYYPVRDNFAVGQAYLLLFCLLAWALVGLAEQAHAGDRLAGLALGLMALLKMAGVWLWPALLLAKRWRTLAWAVILAGVGTGLVLWQAGLAPWARYFSLLPTLAADPKRAVTAYQTTSGLFAHLFVYNERWNPAPLLDAPWLAGLLTLLALLASLISSARVVSLNALQREERLLALAVWGALIVTNAPYAENYHYVLTLPALLLAGWWAWQARLGWRHWVFLVLCAVLLGAALPYKTPHLTQGLWALLAYPRVYGAWLLWAWLVSVGRTVSSPVKGNVGLAGSSRW